LSEDRSNREFWQSRYRTGQIHWDLGGPSAPVRWLVDRYFLPTGKVLIPCCGRGHEAIYLAERGYGVTAVDWILEPLVDLRKAARECHLDIEVVQQDIFELSPACDNAFDVFLEQTCLCSLDPSLYASYEALAYRTLKPGGQLLGVFMEVPWAGGPPYNCPPDVVCGLFPPRRWIHGGTDPVTPRNPARPGPEYTARFVKR
jgi:SAM-dependent methyltransferase